jgi:hypothetical protein
MKLHAGWCEAGFPPDQFWVQTPRTLRSALGGYAERVRQSLRMAMSAAWHGAVLSRATSVPPLSDLLGDERQPQNDDEMTFNLLSWTIATGQRAHNTSQEG